MNNKLSKELEDIIKDAAYRFGTESDDPEVIEKEAVEFGFKASLTMEVLAQVPEVKALLKMNEDLFTDPEGGACFSGSEGDREYFDEVFKPWAPFIKEQE